MKLDWRGSSVGKGLPSMHSPELNPSTTSSRHGDACLQSQHLESGGREHEVQGRLWLYSFIV